MITKTFKTSEVANIIGVHPNTVLLYENIGFISSPKRQDNGYRIFTELHIAQMQLARLALRGEILQNDLRKKAIHIIKLCATCKFEQTIKETMLYQSMLEKEIESAKNAIRAVESMIRKEAPCPCHASYKRQETADMLGVTIDTLRNWELNGLLKIKRKSNGYRVYDETDLNRLKIIRTLRCANYSLSSILRMLNRLSNGMEEPIEHSLNTPGENEDIVSVCDRLLVSLKQALSDARQMQILLQNLKNEKLNPPL